MPHKPLIIVLGAVNQDDVARVARHPMPGETVVADSVDVSQGGKGANQAYAAAVAGADAVRVLLIGAVGDDAAGVSALASLSAAGVDTSSVANIPGVPTGRAYITVSDDGQNSIVVALGANATVSPASIEPSARPDVVVAQTEVGAASVNAISDLAQRAGARLIINNGPVVALDPASLAYADPLVVNQHEALELLRTQRAASGERELAEQLRRRCSARSVVVTLGGEGSVVADALGTRRHDAVSAASVIDTTGAGDTFVGALAAALAVGTDMDAAIDTAAIAAANSVMWQGARAPLG